MRVVAGELGGRRLVAPAGAATRPTAARVKEAIFSMVGPVEGLAVLDLFAGSGALAIEALSRGAARATLVERARPACSAIARNLAELELEDRARLVRRDWRAALRAEQAAARRYGLCVIDPPYGLVDAVARDLPGLLSPLLESRATVVLEHASNAAPQLDDWGTVRVRHYGDSAVSLLQPGVD